MMTKKKVHIPRRVVTLPPGWKELGWKVATLNGVRCLVYTPIKQRRSHDVRI